MPVQIDYGNCLQDSLGPGHGLRQEELTQIQPALRRAHRLIRQDTRRGKIGFLELELLEEDARKMYRQVSRLGKRFENFVLIGIGGSSLGAKAIFNALCPPYWNHLSPAQRRGRPRFFVLDNIDPVQTQALLRHLWGQKTLFHAVSKSGTTAETLANFFLFLDCVKRQTKNWRDHFILSTDPEGGTLWEFAQTEKIRFFPIWKNIGGRFSVLTPVGTVSSAVLGCPLAPLFSGAKAMRARCSTPNLLKNPAALLATLVYLFYWKKKTIHVLWTYSQSLWDLTEWALQLLAESLGKKTRNAEDCVGPTPTRCLGVTDQHSQLQLHREGPNDKLFWFLSLQRLPSSPKIPKMPGHYLGNHPLAKLFKSEEMATRIALTQSERPNLTLRIPELSPRSLGELFMLLELATAYLGPLFQIDPYDQPGVELSKTWTYALMGRKGYEVERKKLAPWIRREQKPKHIV